MRLRILISIFLFMMLSACLPYAEKYTNIYGQEVTNSGYGCAYEYTAPIFATIQSEDIGYKIQIDPDYNNSSSLEITADIDVGLAIEDPAIKIFDKNGKLITEMLVDKPRSKVIFSLKGRPKGSSTLKYWFTFPEHPSFKDDDQI